MQSSLNVELHVGTSVYPVGLYTSTVPLEKQSSLAELADDPVHTLLSGHPLGCSTLADLILSCLP
jgi:hypothetical protein